MGFHGGIYMILGLANVIFGFGLGIPIWFYTGRHRRNRKSAIHRAETVEGVVTHSDIERVRNVGTGAPKYWYRPEIRFQYRFRGRTYTNNHRAYTLEFDPTSETRAYRIVSEYHEGAPVSVYVDPQNPGKGFLDIEETKQNIGSGVLTVIGVTLTGAGFVGLAVLVWGFLLL